MSVPKKESGYVQITDPITGNIERETKMCCHCGMHWIMQPGSGRTRGWCMKCNGVTCGKKKCDSCYPYEEQLQDMERPARMIGFTSLYDEKISKIINVVPLGWEVKNGILSKK